MQILFLRHGITAWNVQKKLQGRSDIALAEAGKTQVLSWHIPTDIVQWYVSPLLRARQTSELLGLNPVLICSDLIEMDWGNWEGQSLDALRKADRRTTSAVTMLENEGKGLDMLPENGESPRQVRQRLHQWMMSLPEQRYIGVITHKGVIRAAISLATGWDMTSKHRIKVRNDRGYLFSWTAGKLKFKQEIGLL